MEKKENQRTRLTRRLLKEALIELLETTQFSALTITDICAKAEINRTTFYKYYANECALYDEIEREFIDRIRTQISQDGQDVLEVLLAGIADNRKVARMLFTHNVNGAISAKIFSLPEIRQRLQMASGGGSPDYERLCFFILSGCYALVREWVNEDCVQPPRALAAFIMQVAEKLLA